jgi:hypothetical protein
MTDRVLTFQKRKVRRPWRRLWSLELFARDVHTCDNCHCPIFPGSIYNRTVLRCSSTRFWVEKVHHDPLCPIDPWEEDWRIQEELERERKEEEKSSSNVA